MRARFRMTVLAAIAAAAPAAGAPAAGAVPRARHAWDFETPALDGGDRYAAEEVPVQVDDRPSQPDWIQLFGAAADPSRPDRFPTHEPAMLSAREPRQGRRSLLLASAGDHLLVRSARWVEVRSGERIRITGWIKTRGLESGSVRVLGRFIGAGREELAGTAVSSEPLRGAGDWSPALALDAEAPAGARDLVLEVLLEGSPADRAARAWIDDLAVEISRSCRISWPGRRSLLARVGEPLAIAVECPALDPGSYRVRIRIIPDGPEIPAAPGPALEVEARRLSAHGEPLRLIEDLGGRLAGEGSAAGLPPGLYRARVEVLSADGLALAAGESSLAWLGELPPGARRAWEYAWDERWECALYRDLAGADTLALRSRSGETVPVGLPAGEPWEAHDLLGRPVAVEFRAADGSWEVRVGEVPVFIQKFPSVKVGRPSGDPSPR